MPYTSGLFELTVLDISGTDSASPVTSGLADTPVIAAGSPVTSDLNNAASPNAGSPVVPGIANSLITAAGSPVMSAEADFVSLRISQAISFGQNVQVDSIFFVDVGNTVAFNQQVDPTIEIQQTVAQSIAFSQTASNVIQVLVQQNISFGSFAFFPQLNAILANSIQFGQQVDVRSVIRQQIDNLIIFQQRAKRGIEDSVANSILFDNSAARGEVGQNTLTFAQGTTVDLGKPSTTSFGFGQIVGVTKTLNISVSSTVHFQGNALGVVEIPCDEGDYKPSGTGFPSLSFTRPTQITLDCGVDSIILRNPDFGNTEAVELERAFNESRSGTPSASRDSTQPSPTRLSFTVQMFSRAKRDELLDFLENCLAEIVTLTDQEGRTRTGVIVNPENAVATNRDGDCGVYVATIEMVVDP